MQGCTLNDNTCKCLYAWVGALHAPCLHMRALHPPNHVMQQNQPQLKGACLLMRAQRLSSTTGWQSRSWAGWGMQCTDSHLSAALAAAGQHCLQAGRFLLPGERRAGAAHTCAEVVVFGPRQHAALTISPVEPAWQGQYLIKVALTSSAPTALSIGARWPQERAQGDVQPRHCG